MDGLSTDLLPDKNLTAAEDAVTLAVAGLAGCAFQVKGTFTGTITFEGTVDGGVWVAMLVVPLGTTASATTASAAGIFLATCAGLQAVRARMSAYTNGYATVTIRAVNSSPDLHALS